MPYRILISPLKSIPKLTFYLVTLPSLLNMIPVSQSTIPINHYCLRFGSSDLRHTQLTAAPHGPRSDKPDPQSIDQLGVSDRPLSQSHFPTSLDPRDFWRRRLTEIDWPYCSSILFTQSTRTDASVFSERFGSM